MKKITTISSSFTLGIILALSGCGGGVTAESKEGITISGKAIDPYLSGSRVCLDLNENRSCDTNEPHTTTNEIGDYALDIALEYHGATHSLLVSGGIDTGTGEPFTGILTAVKEANQTTQHITPLSTAVEARHQYCLEAHDECQDTMEEIESAVADYLNLTADEIHGDIVELADNQSDEPLRVALALQICAEHYNHTNPYRFYEKLVQHDFSGEQSWAEYVESFIPSSPTIITAIMGVDTNDLEEVPETDHTNAHQIAQYAHGLLP
ncbi:MAG TPA: hypothetical protein EYP35_06380 [Desulfobacterales bacterium]|nr:hypothetical protein [Desulfobacterales bacterium]HIP62129.1 hypothetical protein [Sulfurovum sp.]